MSPILFVVEGTPCVLSLLLFRRYTFFVSLLMHTVFYWMIGAILVKFSQLILMKIIKIVATRCQILRLKCTKFNFGWGCALEPMGELTALPISPSWI